MYLEFPLKYLWTPLMAYAMTRPADGQMTHLTNLGLLHMELILTFYLTN
jgi:hypothetical protein